MRFLRQMAVWSGLWLMVGCLLAATGCQSTKNYTYIMILDSNGTTVRADGGSNAKPIEVAREATATIPAAGF